jgi:aquaporin Z
MSRSRSAGALGAALRAHWPEYLLEAAELGLFMVAACGFSVLLFHPESPVGGAIESATTRRALMGLAMGTTAIALIYSPMGQRSGAHMNPSVTLTFWRLGKIEGADAVFYIAAQFLGAILGVTLMAVALGRWIGHPMVSFAATVPGMAGFAAAWAAEAGIACLLMLVVLTVSNRRGVTRYTGLFAGGLVASFILLEDPLSGMSMNPARTTGSAVWANVWTGLWIYFTAPPLGMLLASQIYAMTFGRERVYCAKFHHQNRHRCIFRCRFAELMEPGSGSPHHRRGAA